MSYLSDIKVTKSKMDGITYSGPFALQSYMQSELFNEEMASLLLALRTRTVRGIRSDFGEIFPDKSCPLEGCSLPYPGLHSADWGGPELYNRVQSCLLR